MNEKPNYYGILPASVRYDQDLIPMEKIIFTEITALMQKEGYCYASNKYFAELYNVHKNTVGNWINNLKKYGFINVKIVYKENSKEIRYRKIYPINEIIDRYQRNHLDPINEIIEDNNTSNNTTRGHPTEKQILNEAKRQGIPEETAVKFYLHYESTGWRRIKDFVPLLRKWDMEDKQRNKKQHKKQRSDEWIA